ncbi:MAG: sugar phosphate nucleotidyltransferase [Acidimicrobiia bacterium]
MKAVVLAGGEGTRLRPLTYATPKPLLPIANRPFLEHQLTWLAGHGVTDVVLSIGYRPDVFTGHFGESGLAGLRLTYAVESEPLGTAGAIRFAAETGGFTDLSGDTPDAATTRDTPAPGRFLVCNGDVLTDLDVTALLRFHDESGAEATISLTQVEDPSAFGVVPTDPDGRVLGFVEKPPPGEAPTDWINAGTYVLETSVLGLIPPGRAVSIERETFPALLERDAKLYAHASPGYWLDIGTPAKYLQANIDLLAGGESMCPPDAIVAAGAIVQSSVLGPRVEIGEGARVVRSVLLEGVRVAAGAVVVDSVVGAEAVVGPGSVVEDVSVIGPGAQVPAGARLAGARLAA